MVAGIRKTWSLEFAIGTNLIGLQENHGAWILKVPEKPMVLENTVGILYHGVLEKTLSAVCEGF